MRPLRHRRQAFAVSQIFRAIQITGRNATALVAHSKDRLRPEIEERYRLEPRNDCKTARRQRRDLLAIFGVEFALSMRSAMKRAWRLVGSRRLRSGRSCWRTDWRWRSSTSACSCRRAKSRRRASHRPTREQKWKGIMQAARTSPTPACTTLWCARGTEGGFHGNTRSSGSNRPVHGTDCRF